MTLLRTLLLFALALLALPAAAQELPPRPEGPVYDGANMIDAATEAKLDEELRAYNKATGRAVIVATVPSLDGETVEGYAVKLYETWGIGGEETDEGALLLVAKKEQKIRIEVGYGSTPTLTDAMSGRIIRNTITPAFKQGDFSGGIAAGVAQMIENDRYCIDVLNQVQAIKAALGRAESEILKRHAACCVADAIASGDADEQKQKFSELVDLFEKAKR